MRTKGGGGGVKNPENSVDVLNGLPLTHYTILIDRISDLEKAAS